MNTRNVKWFYQQLPELVSRGIISQQNADQIQQYYGQIADTGKKTFLVVCSIVGALLIGLGIVSLIAHNWDQLGRPIRAILSMLPVIIGICLTGWALLKRGSSDSYKEGTSLFLSLMIGASIALICQTYNISGDIRNFTLTWMLLTIPLVYLATATLPAVIYVIGITTWSLGYVWDNARVSFFYWLLILAVIPHFVMAIRDTKFVVRSMLLSTFLAISLGLVTSWTLVSIFPALWVISLPLVFSVVYLTGKQKFGQSGVTTSWQQPFNRLGNLGIVIMSLILTYRWPWSENHSSYWMGSVRVGSSFAGYTILFLLICIAVVLEYFMIKQKRQEDSLRGAFPIVALIGFALKPLAMPLFNIYFLMLCIQQIISGIRFNRLAVVNSGLLMLAVLIALRFFDSDINFVLKGLVMIALGVGFLATNAILISRRGGK